MANGQKMRALVVCDLGRLGSDLNDEVLKLAAGSTIVSFFNSRWLEESCDSGLKCVSITYGGHFYDLIVVTSRLYLTIPHWLRDLVIVACKFDEDPTAATLECTVIRYGKQPQPA